MSDSFRGDPGFYAQPGYRNLRAYGRIIAIILFFSVLSWLTVALILALLAKYCLGFPTSPPGPLRLIRDHEADLVVYAQRAIAGDVGNQPDARNGLLLEKHMPSYDVRSVDIVDHCLVINFDLPWFDGPIWTLVYAPTMTKEAQALIHPSDPMILLEYKDLGHGWHYVSQDMR